MMTIIGVLVESVERYAGFSRSQRGNWQGELRHIKVHCISPTASVFNGTSDSNRKGLFVSDHCLHWFSDLTSIGNFEITLTISSWPGERSFQNLVAWIKSYHTRKWCSGMTSNSEPIWRFMNLASVSFVVAPGSLESFMCRWHNWRRFPQGTERASWMIVFMCAFPHPYYDVLTFSKAILCTAVEWQCEQK